MHLIRRWIQRSQIASSIAPRWANLEECEKHPDQAKILNVSLPRELAGACAKRNIKFIHLSTDAVFDGTKDGAYTEEDEPNPQGVYSQTKLDSEHAVQEAYPQAIIARVTFFGWSLTNRRSLGEFFVNNLSEGRNVNGFTDIMKESRPPASGTFILSSAAMIPAMKATSREY